MPIPHKKQREAIRVAQSFAAIGDKLPNQLSIVTAVGAKLLQAGWGRCLVLQNQAQSPGKCLIEYTRTGLQTGPCRDSGSGIARSPDGLEKTSYCIWC